jgi:tetratricopeptide (TPR) repeat protein
VTYQEQGNYAEAQARYEQSLAIEVELGDKGGIATSLHQLGVIHQQQGNLREAQAKYEQALGIFGELGDKTGIAYSLGSLGNLHYLQGDYQVALERYEECLRISRELGDRSSVAGALHQLGMIHQLRGSLGEAQARYEQSLAIKMELGDQSGIASSLHQLGMIHQEQKSYREALEKWVQALVLFEQLESPDAQITRRKLARLRGEIGEEAFAAALAELEAKARGVSETGAVTLEQMVGLVVHSTVAVMTEVSDGRKEWWGALEQLQAQARQHGDAGFAAFLRAVRQVVEGADPARVSVELEEPFAEAWRRLVEELQRTC